jgi:hypothetical protein
MSDITSNTIIANKQGTTIDLIPYFVSTSFSDDVSNSSPQDLHLISSLLFSAPQLGQIIACMIFEPVFFIPDTIDDSKASGCSNRKFRLIRHCVQFVALPKFSVPQFGQKIVVISQAPSDLLTI